jgi:hypothetical protein
MPWNSFHHSLPENFDAANFHPLSARRPAESWDSGYRDIRSWVVLSPRALARSLGDRRGLRVESGAGQTILVGINSPFRYNLLHCFPCCSVFQGADE